MMRMMQGEDDMIDVLTKSIEEVKLYGLSSLLFLFNNVTIMEMSQSCDISMVYECSTSEISLFFFVSRPSFTRSQARIKELIQPDWINLHCGDLSKKMNGSILLMA